MTPRPVACGPAPVTRLPGPVPGTCFAGPLSPWPPSLAPPAPRRITPLCSSASLLLRRSQTSRVRASSASTPRLPDADLGAFALRPNPRPPGSRAKSFHTCQGLRPRRAGRPLAIPRPSMSPSVFLTTSAPETICFRGSMAGLCTPLSTLHRHPRGYRRMTRGRCGLLLLHRSGLSPLTLCRFLPAHRDCRVFAT